MSTPKIIFAIILFLLLFYHVVSQNVLEKKTRKYK